MTAKTIPSYVDVDTQHCGHVGAGIGNCLDDVYGSYSVAKSYAWQHCKRLCCELDGRYLCITSRNTCVFTAQFEFDNPENGRPMVCHITPSHVYAMYTDMHYIESARIAWQKYATIFAHTGQMPDTLEIYDGIHVMWVGGTAYIIAYDEVYRVTDAWTKAHKLRKRVELQRVGAVDDSVINRIISTHHAVCGSVLPCTVYVGAEHSRCIVYAHLVMDDMPSDCYVGWDAIMTVLCSLGHTVAMCVDACMMMHGIDAQGATVRLMD